MIAVAIVMSHPTVEIDTQWNVNLADSEKSGIFDAVEIDTQWNVNIMAGKSRYLLHMVEIDTQWNVNLMLIPAAFAAVS